jgi:hypothetical protein
MEIGSGIQKQDSKAMLQAYFQFFKIRKVG